jgi:inosine-uridine nucleoside N-ribohydrolase
MSRGTPHRQPSSISLQTRRLNIYLAFSMLFLSEKGCCRFAATEVLRAATNNTIPFVLVPLDITSQYTISFSRLIPYTLPADAPATLGSFLSIILARPRSVLCSLGYTGDCFEMHDPFAAWYAVCQAANIEDVGQGVQTWQTGHREFLIERIGEWTKGTCVVDKR